MRRARLLPDPAPVSIGSPPVITHLRITGMRSVHCSRAVMTALNTVDGILHADVTIGRATIEHDGRATACALGAAVELAGYRVSEIEEERRRLPIA